MSPKFSFDRIAPVYDSLSYLVFGGSIQKAQRHFIHTIPASTRVLIIGGGSGRILNDLLGVVGINHITYIEASLAMVRQSKKVADKYRLINPDCSVPEIIFINGTEQDASPIQKYDVVITNFVLDMYYGSSLNALMTRIDRLLLPNANWLFADFRYSKQPLRRIWQRPLARLMYIFFYCTTGIAIQPLPNYDMHFEKIGWHTKQHKTFFGDFICSKIYQRIS